MACYGSILHCAVLYIVQNNIRDAIQRTSYRPCLPHLWQNVSKSPCSPYGQSLSWSKRRTRNQLPYGEEKTEEVKGEQEQVKEEEEESSERKGAASDRGKEENREKKEQPKIYS